jgi:hypothetical protein
MDSIREFRLLVVVTSEELRYMKNVLIKWVPAKRVAMFLAIELVGYIIKEIS